MCCGKASRESAELALCLLAAGEKTEPQTEFWTGDNSDLGCVW